MRRSSCLAADLKGRCVRCFTSRFVRTLVARLETIEDSDLIVGDREHRKSWPWERWKGA